MKIYIAAKFQDVYNYRKLKYMLEKEGHKITIDWTDHTNVAPFSSNIELSNRQALEDIKGIEDSDVVILLYNGVKGSGMSFEIGYATALNKKVLVIGKESKDYSMFINLPNFIHLSIEELLIYLQSPHTSEISNGVK